MSVNKALFEKIFKDGKVKVNLKRRYVFENKSIIHVNKKKEYSKKMCRNKGEY